VIRIGINFSSRIRCMHWWVNYGYKETKVTPKCLSSLFSLCIICKEGIHLSCYIRYLYSFFVGSTGS
jgi:hypothetical protein